MTMNAIEKALWRAVANRADMQRLRDDLPGYLAGFRIAEDERAELLDWEVGRLVARGVNPLLLMTVFSGAFGPQRMGEYRNKINDPARAEASHG